MIRDLYQWQLDVAGLSEKYNKDIADFLERMGVAKVIKREDEELTDDMVTPLDIRTVDNSANFVAYLNSLSGKDRSWKEDALGCRDRFWNTFIDGDGDDYRALWTPEHGWLLAFYSKDEAEWQEPDQELLKEYGVYEFHDGRRFDDATEHLDELDEKYRRPYQTVTVTEPIIDMASFEGGGVRSSQDGKPRFDLLFTPGVPYEEQLLYRVAIRMAEGAKLYGEHNYAKMVGLDALNRANGSMLRHDIQHFGGESDEDHLAAVVCNAIMISKIEHNIAKEQT